MLHATNSRMGVRLALLDPERDSALVFESARARTAGCAAAAARARAAAAAAARARASLDGLSAPPSAAPPSGPLTDTFGRSVFLPADPTEDVTVREIPLAHTLLSSAVSGPPTWVLRSRRSTLPCVGGCALPATPRPVLCLPAQSIPAVR
jgi:hypothetical protein